jgi:suppressor of ftsI
VNASPDLYADLQLSHGTITVIARDGMPLSFHDPAHRTEIVRHVLLAPASRVEGIVTGPPRDAHATLSSRCVSTGPDGDPNPAMVLADLTAGQVPAQPLIRAAGPTVYYPIPAVKLAAVERSQPEFTVVFTEDKQGFYINRKKYTPNAAPMITEPIGDFHHWRVANQTHEAHQFHIHQVHFLPYVQDGVRITPPDWLDTINVPPGGKIEMVMDFTDPIIRGMSVFHCHLLKHEDKGMMAKILFVDSKQ